MKNWIVSCLTLVLTVLIVYLSMSVVLGLHLGKQYYPGDKVFISPLCIHGEVWREYDLHSWVFKKYEIEYRHPISKKNHMFIFSAKNLSDSIPEVCKVQ